MGIGFFDAIDASGARPFAEARSQAEELIAAALGQDLNAAISVVAHPAGDTEDVSLTLDKPAETHTLHASANYEAAGFHLFCH